MKLLFFLPYLPFTLLLITSCQPSTSAEEDASIAENIFIEWELVSNQISDRPQFRINFLLKNNGSRVLGNTGWAIYFNQRTVDVIPESVTESVNIKHLGGDFMELSPRGSFHLSPGEEMNIRADYNGWLIKEDQAPAGIYIVFYREDGGERSRHSLKNFTIRPFVRPEQINRFSIDQTSNPTPEWQYVQNEVLKKLDKAEVPLIIPTPKEMTMKGGTATVNGSWMIHFRKGLESEATFLAGRLNDFLGVKLSSLESDATGENIINLHVSDNSNEKESYQLNVTNDQGIRIEGSDASGVFYGIQSLLALVSIENYKNKLETISIPACTIADGPRFLYRGMHLDVARNFNQKEAVFKLIDVMSFYKFNTLHMHLTDDEGWRIEIKELPELTEVGAFRGHTLDDGKYLHPSYGSGPEPDSPGTYGSGFYTREDYIQILKYAKLRHVNVIPEFDLPGHARAAIKSMDARYRRFIKEDNIEKANEYLLADPGDKSEYRSAQDFSDNVICVCQESTYRFVETVVDDVVEIYREAGVPLATVHIGGDEVPKGAWEKSPVCDEFIENNTDITNPKGLMDYFLMRTSQILRARDLIMSGWEEITLDRSESGDYAVKPPLKGNKFQVYIWDNFTEGNQDIGYKVANAGYPVVLCSVTNFYFELAYNKDPKEPGDFWGGFVDTYKAFEYIPYDVFKCIHTTPLGKPYDRDKDFQDMVRLNPGAIKNILGLQGELWSEPIKGPDMLEYFYLPKMLGLAERAWAPQPSWENDENDELRQETLQKGWNVFANIVGQREMPRLDYMFGGYHYRLPPPGAKLVNGTLNANVQFPGLSIRYTIDGSDPTINSMEFTSPTQVQGSIKLRTFNSVGRGSRVVSVQ